MGQYKRLMDEEHLYEKYYIEEYDDDHHEEDMKYHRLQVRKDKLDKLNEQIEEFIKNNKENEL